MVLPGNEIKRYKDLYAIDYVEKPCTENAYVVVTTITAGLTDGNFLKINLFLSLMPMVRPGTVRGRLLIYRLLAGRDQHVFFCIHSKLIN